MRFALSVILIMLLSFVVCLYLPWWSIAIAAFLVTATIPQSSFMSFITGFCSLFLLWGGLCFWISSNNDQILAHKMSLLILKTDSPYLLILVSAVVGALIGGLAGLAGSCLKRPPAAVKKWDTN